MPSQIQKRLIQFLGQDLGLPTDVIQLALRHSQSNSIVFPMILWQYGLVTVQQLEKIWDWLDSISSLY